MRKIITFILCGIFIVASLGFKLNNNSLTVEKALSNMNLFYTSNGISMNFKTEFTSLDGKKEISNLTSISISENKFLSENKNEIHLRNSKYYLLINKSERTILVNSIKDGVKNSVIPTVNESIKVFLSKYKKASLKETDASYIVELTDADKMTNLLLSKKEFYLMEYSYHFFNNKFYKKASTYYTDVKVKKEVNSSFFSEEKFIKQKRKTIKGIGEFKDYKIIAKSKN